MRAIFTVVALLELLRHIIVDRKLLVGSTDEVAPKEKKQMGMNCLSYLAKMIGQGRH